MNDKPTFEEIEKALDEGRLEVETPDGRWVRAHRRARTRTVFAGYRRIEMTIDGGVLFAVTNRKPFLGDLRIAT